LSRKREIKAKEAVEKKREVWGKLFYARMYYTKGWRRGSEQEERMRKRERERERERLSLRTWEFKTDMLISLDIWGDDSRTPSFSLKRHLLASHRKLSFNKKLTPTRRIYTGWSVGLEYREFSPSSFLWCVSPSSLIF